MIQTEHCGEVQKISCCFNILFSKKKKTGSHKACVSMLLVEDNVFECAPGEMVVTVVLTLKTPSGGKGKQ